MQEFKSHLCVGGPKDGQRFLALQHELRFRVPVIPKVSITEFPDPGELVTVSTVEYREERFHTPDGFVAFWVPENQTSLDTIKMLLETYEKAKS